MTDVQKLYRTLTRASDDQLIEELSLRGFVVERLRPVPHGVLYHEMERAKENRNSDGRPVISGPHSSSAEFEES